MEVSILSFWPRKFFFQIIELLQKGSLLNVMYFSIHVKENEPEDSLWAYSALSGSYGTP